jgi:hypothetical protein
MPAVLLIDPTTRKPIRILRGSAAHLPAYYDAARATPPTAILYTDDGAPVRPPIYETDAAGRKTATGEGDPIPTRPISELPTDLDAVKVDKGKVKAKTKAERDTDKAERQSAKDLADAAARRESLIQDRILRDTRAAAIASLIADGSIPR